jgi:hypothetical protein
MSVQHYPAESLYKLASEALKASKAEEKKFLENLQKVTVGKLDEMIK